LVHSLKMKNTPLFNVDLKLGLKICDRLFKDKKDLITDNNLNLTTKSYSSVLKKLLKDKEIYCETENMITVNRSNIADYSLSKNSWK